MVKGLALNDEIILKINLNKLHNCSYETCQLLGQPLLMMLQSVFENYRTDEFTLLSRFSSRKDRNLNYLAALSLLCPTPHSYRLVKGWSGTMFKCVFLTIFNLYRGCQSLHALSQWLLSSKFFFQLLTRSKSRSAQVAATLFRWLLL